MSVTALDDSGVVAVEAQPPVPYQASEAARARLQSRYMINALAPALEEVGSSLAATIYLEQFVALKAHSDGYFAEALAPEALGSARPVGATAQVGGFHPHDAAVGITGMAVIPEPGSGHVKGYPGEDPAKPKSGGKFAGIVTAGPYAVATVFPSDRKSGVPDEIRVQDWIWSGSEIRNEAEWALEQLSVRLAEAGASLTDIVNYTLFLSDTGDLYEWDLVWREALGDITPSRTVIPTKGFALPRSEGAFGHGQGAPRMEAQFRAVVPDARDQRITVEGPGGGVGHQAAGVRVGPLLWVSAQTAEADTRRDEVAGALASITEVCATAGTDLSQLLSVRAIVTEPDIATLVYSALRSAVGRDPPAVTILVADRPLPEVDRSVSLDAVALVG